LNNCKVVHGFVGPVDHRRLCRSAFSCNVVIG